VTRYKKACWSFSWKSDEGGIKTGISKIEKEHKKPQVERLEAFCVFKIAGVELVLIHTYQRNWQFL
jgi:hypothetical protein